MLGSTHFITGSAIGKLSGNPILTAIFAFIAHFLMDLIPHWDYGYHFRKTFLSFLIAALEPFIGISIIVWIIINRDFDRAMIFNIFIGGFFCLLPDALSVFIKLFKIKPLRLFLIFHNKVHWFIKSKEKIDEFEWKTKKISSSEIFWGIVWQMLFIVISIMILWR